MLTSVVSESMRLVMTQHLLVRQTMHPMQGLFYISSACSLCLMLLVSSIRVMAGVHALVMNLGTSKFPMHVNRQLPKRIKVVLRTCSAAARGCWCHAPRDGTFLTALGALPQGHIGRKPKGWATASRPRSSLLP